MINIMQNKIRETCFPKRSLYQNGLKQTASGHLFHEVFGGFSMAMCSFSPGPAEEAQILVGLSGDISWVAS